MIFSNLGITQPERFDAGTIESVLTTLFMDQKQQHLQEVADI